ncbi:ABC transporter substrate-binding protein [uncultured Anaerococcus sp.]|uniref:siderophore ABC transporter substrate-binding protein n=1 Tax=uncultured Anaerococcus sp. TaxID=293428 RepID=UPI0028897F8E|nr:ABC transporter substrate-binding protein [uncultured Anaerococcus sp.]
MKNKLIIAMLLASLTLTACNKEAAKDIEDKAESQVEQAAETKADEKDKGEEVSDEKVTIKDLTGEVEVKKNPKKVVALDNRTFETLQDWGIKLVAAPKPIMPATSEYKKDDSIADIGNHKEPNLEALAAADPDLIIVGQRFGKYTDELKKLCPNADVIDLNWDVSEEAENPGENLINGLKDSVDSLGKIFDKEDEAEELKIKLDDSIAKAKEAYKGGSVVSVVVSGGEIGYSAPKYGRVWGPLYDVLGLKPAIEVTNTSSDHKGDDISVESIAQANPAYLLVLDRDAAVTKDGEESTPASDVIEGSEALKATEAIKKSAIYYAPADTYTNESPQTFIKIFEGLADLFVK